MTKAECHRSRQFVLKEDICLKRRRPVAEGLSASHPVTPEVELGPRRQLDRFRDSRNAIMRQTKHGRDDLIQKPAGNAADTADISTKPAPEEDVGTNAIIAATAAAGGISGAIVAAGLRRPKKSK